MQSPTVNGIFSFRIPMKHIFGFCEDYDKIVYGSMHILALARKTMMTSLLELQQLVLKKSV